MLVGILSTKYTPRACAALCLLAYMHADSLVACCAPVLLLSLRSHSPLPVALLAVHLMLLCMHADTPPLLL